MANRKTRLNWINFSRDFYDNVNMLAVLCSLMTFILRNVNCPMIGQGPMIWKDYLKLSEIASYSKLARASKAPPPPHPPRWNRVKPVKLFVDYEDKI